jgi:hypothetical protein
MSAGEQYHTNWWPTTGTATSTFGPSYTVAPATYTYNPVWPPAAAEGWRCPACQLVMAPWVPYHQCDGASETSVLNKADDGEDPA